MNDSVPPLKVLVASLLLLGLGACASTDRWSAAGGNREAGVVRVSYEYPEFHPLKDRSVNVRTRTTATAISGR